MSTRAAVLVIDDEPGIRDMLAYELSMEGFDVETADSGMAAVEAVKRRKFDLAVTDLKMPGMDGVATVEALRSLDPDIEVIVATGYASVETAVACMKRGAYDYIQKPYDLAELKLLLERATQKSHLQSVVALYEASRALMSTLNHADLVQLVVTLAQRVLRADNIGLLLRNKDEKGFTIHRLTEEVLPWGFAPRRAGPACHPGRDSAAAAGPFDPGGPLPWKEP
jgi:DNA-binding NtrC family response regulator